MEALDEGKGTPLHWAAYYGYDQAVSYFCAWGIQLNIKD